VLGRILLHVACVYLGVVVSMILLAVLGLLVPPLGRVTNPIGRFINEPIWGLQAPIAIFIGYQISKRLPCKEAFVAWIVPGIFLLVSAWSWHLTTSQYDSVWDTYFGKDCGGSECLYEGLLTVPFYAGIAYTLGAFAAALNLRRERVGSRT
jgi:hypothetical protein